MRALSFPLLLYCLFAASVAALLRGAPRPSAPWTTHDNLVYRGSDVVTIKGINWHGFETDCRVLHGLWKYPIDHYLDILANQRFNAVRVPLAFEAMEDLDLPVNAACTPADPSLYAGITVRGALGVFLDKLAARGMAAVLDLHTIGGVITEMPWTPDVDERRVVQAWTTLAAAFGRHPAIMGLDIKNEPHGACTTAAFHAHVARVVAAIGDAFAGLYFVSGTSESSAWPLPPWGGTFEAMDRTACDDLCRLGMPHRIVFAPHVYGPDVRGPDAEAEDDDHAFHDRFGFLRDHAFFNRSAIVVTEFGGHLQGADLAYFERWRAYSHRRNLTAGAFLWTLPPTSYDTGGLLLDDFQTLDDHKLRFMTSLSTPLPQ